MFCTPRSFTLISCASLLAVACAGNAASEDKTDQEGLHVHQHRDDGTAEIETEQEAADVALWFLRGRGYLDEDRLVETTVIEQDKSWFVGVSEPGEEHPIGSDMFVNLARNGHFLRVTFGR